MQPFTSKELYMMNGGQKLYIYKDGFGDVYEATAAEEAEWAQEVVEGALIKIATEKHSEAVVMQNLYDYILNHLEEPLPTLKELAVLFDTNEYKLKHGFREFFKTSIYNGLSPLVVEKVNKLIVENSK